MTEYLTPKEYAARYKVKLNTVYRYIRQCKVPFIRLGDGGPRSPVRIVVSEDHQNERGE